VTNANIGGLWMLMQRLTQHLATATGIRLFKL
jgi:hypothetical protein